MSKMPKQFLTHMVEKLHTYLSQTPEDRVKLGICAMDKKAQSKPMKEVLSRLEKYGDFDIIIFGDDCILNKPPEEWPVVEVLISFFSGGFPMEKTLEYIDLRKPFQINDLQAQKVLFSRPKIYDVLKEADIPTPRHAVVWRDDSEHEDSIVEEEEDCIIINGERFPKPFVEKPVNAEDHNIRIYYPRSAGGGCTRLFRKVGDKSSEFMPSCSTIRTNGSYLYEDFLATEGTDVKIYAVGDGYAHAEARKSPAVDGKVQRDEQGKEVRFPVMLTAVEKIISLKVIQAFKQTVCGFDLLRTNGESFVCDVNGWSFVKSNHKYYEDAAYLLRETMLKRFAPVRLKQFQGSLSDPLSLQEMVTEHPEDHRELRCVIGVFRHGDRTPKQKLKMVVKNEKFLSFFDGKDSRKELKMKRASELQKLLDISRELLSDGGPGSDIEERTDKLQQVRAVLERGGHFGGINRKVQLKPLKWTRAQSSAGEGGMDKKGKIVEAQLILKWGGELTKLGRNQALDLSEQYRSTIYPGESEGLLRLHATFRHDLKIYCSDEGRVQLTAAAFTKGFLQLEGSLTPILVSLCRKDTDLLDDTSGANKDLDAIKTKIKQLLTTDDSLLASKDLINCTDSVSLNDALEKIGNPVETLQRLYELITQVTEQLRGFSREDEFQSLVFNGETIHLILKRWEKLENDIFHKKKKKFDISKIPDIYDCAKYDLLHNRTLELVGLVELYEVVSTLADVVIPQEYGLTKCEKVEVGYKVAKNLIRKILLDLALASESYKHSSELLGKLETVHRLDHRYAKTVGVRSSQRHVRTRLYFTSESHIHSLMNVLRFAGKDEKGIMTDEAAEYLSNVQEFNFLSQIVFLLYENYSVPEGDPERYSVELTFSPGVNFENIKTQVEDPELYPRIVLNSTSLDDMEIFLNECLDLNYGDTTDDGGLDDEDPPVGLQKCTSETCLGHVTRSSSVDPHALSSSYA